VRRIRGSDKVALAISVIGCVTGVTALSWQVATYLKSREEVVLIGYAVDGSTLTVDIRNAGSTEIYLDDVYLTLGRQAKGFEWNADGFIIYGHDSDRERTLEGLTPGNVKRFYFTGISHVTDEQLEEFDNESRSSFMSGWQRPQAYIVVKTSKNKYVQPAERWLIYSAILSLRRDRAASGVQSR
jgi:hypothetical protein